MPDVVVTTLLGGLLVLAGTAVAPIVNFLNERQRQAREDRASALKRQADTLLDLQAAIRRVLDEWYAGRSSEFGRDAAPHWAKMQQASVEVRALAERVRDPKLRELAEEFAVAADLAVEERNNPERADRMLDAFDLANKQLGEVFRQIG